MQISQELLNLREMGEVRLEFFRIHYFFTLGLLSIMINNKLSVMFENAIIVKLLAKELTL